MNPFCPEIGSVRSPLCGCPLGRVPECSRRGGYRILLLGILLSKRGIGEQMGFLKGKKGFVFKFLIN